MIMLLNHDNDIVKPLKPTWNDKRVSPFVKKKPFDMKLLFNAQILKQLP